jgi:putative tryptophan/tyrosine transport system substrate-binding protein
MNSRREFIALLGGTAATWPLAARAQQSAMPVIGLLTSRGPGDTPQLLAAFRQGLRDGGFVEGQNIAVEYRFAGNRNERLPALAADLVQRQVSLIAATTTPAALAAKAAATTIPIVFEIGFDPVALGLVAALNRPGGNLTGVTNSGVEVVLAGQRVLLRPTVMRLLRRCRSLCCVHRSMPGRSSCRLSHTTPSPVARYRRR